MSGKHEATLGSRPASALPKDKPDCGDPDEVKLVEEAASFIKNQVPYTPTIGIICGSGLGKIADALEHAISIHFADIPHFPTSSVAGHGGYFVFGEMYGKHIACMKGRVHPYEGISSKKSVFPVRVMKMLGVKTIIITNAVGGINEAYESGDIVLLKDHISILALAGLSPLVGLNDERFGPRFPSMINAYDKKCRELVKEVARMKNIRIFEGVYVMDMGPAYETPAEARFIQKMGGDVVGMSCTLETIAARHMGVRVIGLSLVSNKVELDSDADQRVVSHEEVLAVMDRTVKTAIELMKGVIEALD